MIAQNLQRVQARIDAACAAAGRDPRCVKLLAVSKTMPTSVVEAAFAAGQRAFGENYIQEGVDKIRQLAFLKTRDPALEWHCIGPVQSNKTRLVAEHFDWVHTVDRLKIAQRLSAQRPATMPPLQVCIQVNIDGGSSKSGVAPEDAQAVAVAVAQLPNLTLRGLMCIPEIAPDFEAACVLFMAVKGLFDQTKTQHQGAPGFAGFDTLSMGMTADLEAAVQCGSTLVRVGTAIFGARLAKDLLVDIMAGQ